MNNPKERIIGTTPRGVAREVLLKESQQAVYRALIFPKLPIRYLVTDLATGETTEHLSAKQAEEEYNRCTMWQQEDQ